MRGWGDMKETLDSMRERMSWNVARVVLGWAGVEPSKGWERTLSRYAEEENPEAEGRLQDFLKEHNICGEKFTKVYQISDEERDALQVSILNMEVEESEFSKAYPLSVAPELITNLGPPVLVDIVKNDDGVGAVYASAIRLTKREVIDFESFQEDHEALQNEYDEIIGLKFKTVQLFSVVWVPHGDASVEIRTDLPSGMLMEFAQALQSTLRQTINSLGIVSLVNPIDLYPLLEAIYQADGEGDVVELGFLTTTASVKNEKMRRTKLDLRKEPYHLHGKEGLGTPIEPFRMFVRWGIEVDGAWLAPELGLVGTARGRSTIGQPGAVGISGAVIRNCYGRPDFEHVIGKIREYLPKPKGEVSSSHEDEKTLVEA